MGNDLVNNLQSRKWLLMMRWKGCEHSVYFVRVFFLLLIKDRKEKNNMKKNYNSYASVKYDYDDFRKRFAVMSPLGVRLEYAAILNALERLKRKPEDIYFEYAEPLQQAQMFIEGYLARELLMRNKGFYYDFNGQICYDSHGRDVLHSR